MIADLRPYPAYTKSAAQWLGQLPSSWTLKRAKFLFRESDERSTTGTEELLSVSHLTGITPRSQKTVTMFLAKSNVGHKLCRPDDLVINTMWAWMGALGVSSHSGIVSPAYGVYRPQPGYDFQPRYANYLLRTPICSDEYLRSSTGVNSSRLRLYPEQFLRMSFPLPAASEQSAIVRCLDWATRNLERAIQSKRKVITLLDEQRRGIIARTIALGLNPSAPMKSSGIPWVDDIPVHWKAVALKRVLRRLVDCEHKTAPHVEESPFRVVRTTAVRYGALRLHGTYCTSAEAFRVWTKRGVPEAGDVIFTREAPAGEACIVPKGMNLCLGQRTVLMKPDQDRLTSQFLVHAIYAGPPRVAITLASQGSTVGHFNMADIASLPMLLPPRQEQDEIVTAIEGKTFGLGVAIARLEREIQLLREYRTRLITDIVTGQLDVRQAAVRLPEEGPPDTSQLEATFTDEMELADEEAAE